jgi:hypothetical protein
MKHIKIIATFTVLILLYSCSTTQTILKSEAYKGMYEEKPLTILIMPPINNSTAIEAKDYFHSTLYVPLANAGYYVIPPFLSMEILKRESAYDTEMFIEAPLNKFGEVFGADIVLFTIINTWNKTYGSVNVDVEYILKSTKTNEILYNRKGLVSYNTQVSSQGGGIAGALIAAAATAINTAATRYIDVARSANAYTFSDIPGGKYAPTNPNEANELAGAKEFKVVLNSNYK